MKEEIFLYFIGTAGSGKSTLTHLFKQWTELRGIDSITVNLDPGSESLPYEPDVDIREWVSLQEVMETHELGPNGAQIACADMVALNIEEVKDSIEFFKTDYVLVDTPGQLELFVFRESGKHIVESLAPQRSVIVYLIDPVLARSPSGFVSHLLLSMSTNFRLGKPQVNILSKADLLSKDEVALIQLWSQDTSTLYDAITQENPSILREMSEELLMVLQGFETQSKLIPTGKNDFLGIEDLYTIIQLVFKGGEDTLSD
ncbi:MAG TPA: GTPase [Thermoplasmatales archaeon]|nr:GTPase [Thermoplasmatales archaeon]